MKRSLDIARMNLRVGLMSLGAFAILVWVLFFPVRGVSTFSTKLTVKGYFDRVDGLRRNAPVYYRGIEVGQVRSVLIAPGRASAPLEVVVAVEERVVHLLPKSTVMEITSRGLLGDVFVDMVAPQAPAAGTATIAEGDILATKPFSSMMDGFGGVADSMRSALDNLNSLLAKAQSSASTVGRLFVEDDLYKELVAAVRELKTVAGRIGDIERTINEKLLDKGTKKAVDDAVATAQRVLDSAEKTTSKAQIMKWHLGLGFSKYEGSTYAGMVNVRIIPNKDKYYEGGLQYFNALVPWGPKDTLAGGWAGYDAALAFRVLGSPFFFRGGLKHTSVDAGLDLRLYEVVGFLPLELVADASKFGQATAQFDVGLKISFLKDFRLTGGVDDLANTPRYRAGLSFIYDDEDLTTIIVKSRTGM